MSGAIETITSRIEPGGLVDGEVTTTFGDEDIDDQVEALVATLTSTLMDSEHVEDVFTEDNVIKRDVFRVIRDALLAQRRGLSDEHGGPVHVRLDTLGYVASTAGKRAPAAALREALERAAKSAGGVLKTYDPEVREATFSLESSDPDARLELEEAVADELSDLIDAGVVTLPMMERTIDLSRKLDLGPRSNLRQRIDAIAAKMLRQGGCAASWELVGDQRLKIRVTPLSEQDALEVDSHMTALLNEIVAVIGEPAEDRGVAGAAQRAEEQPRGAGALRRAPAEARQDERPDDEESKLDEEDEDEAPAARAPSRRAGREPGEPPATSAAARREAEKRSATKAASAATKAAATSEKKAAPRAAPAGKATATAPKTTPAAAKTAGAAAKKAAPAAASKTTGAGATKQAAPATARKAPPAATKKAPSTAAKKALPAATKSSADAAARKTTGAAKKTAGAAAKKTAAKKR